MRVLRPFAVEHVVEVLRVGRLSGLLARADAEDLTQDFAVEVQQVGAREERGDVAI
jgi:hypothetical protein